MGGPGLFDFRKIDALDLFPWLVGVNFGHGL
jgi:hypothetical protein